MVYGKVPKGFNRKAFLSKGILKRETAKIFVSRLLELSLKKTLCKSLCNYLNSEVLCNFYQVCVTMPRKGACPDLLERLDQDRFFS